MPDLKDTARQLGMPGELLVVLLLIAATGAAYWQTRENDFVGFDDQRYITANGMVKGGLSLEGLKWALADYRTDYWHPLTWVSHMADVSLFGLWAGGHHLVSLLIHILNTLLLFGLLRYATGRVWPAALVAALFAVHPLHVESVAWAAERKDVLSTFFLFLALWAYMYYVRRPGWMRYAAVVGLYALGLLSKPMLVTMPLVLFLVDYWPLGRFDIRGLRITPKTTSLWVLVLEKVPLAAMALAVSVPTIIGQQTVGAMSKLANYGLMPRMANAVLSYWRYIGKMFWPTDLTVLYSFPVRTNWLLAVLALLGLVGVTVAAVRLGGERRYVLSGWLWYLISLVPVIGLVQVGPQPYADRYTYVPLTGLFIILAWGLEGFVAKRRSLAVPVAVGATVLLAAACAITWKTVGHWKNTRALATRAVSVTRDNYVMHVLLASSYLEEGDYDSAETSLLKALRAGPRASMPFSLSLFGRLRYEQGRYDEAVKYCDATIAIDANFTDAWLFSGAALAETGDFTESEKRLRRAIELSPRRAQAHAALGRLMGETGRLEEGIALYNKALALDPMLEDVQFNLGVLYRRIGDFRSAALSYGRSIELKPTPEAWDGLGDCLVALGNIPRAEHAYRESLRLDPGRAVAHYNLAVLLAGTGRMAEAVAEAGRAVALEPDNKDATQLYRRLTGTGESEP
jgi:tetratricopeptide (TPR) repeat protein